MRSTDITPDRLAATLFGKSQRSIIGLLFGKSPEAYYAREISRLAGVSAGTAQRELARLESVGLVRRFRKGRHVYYEANEHCPIFGELRGIALKTMGVVPALAAALEPERLAIDVAFVFGSVADATAVAGSDIDLFVVGEISFGRVAELAAAAEAELSREVNAVVFSPAELRKRRAASDHFITRVLDGPKLFLIGDDDELG